MIAVIETKPSKFNFKKEFPFEFDRYSLTSDASLKKVLKKDCDIQIDLDKYEWVILIGSEPTKYFTKLTSVTDYSGKKFNDKFLIAINPGMLAFKPEVKPLWEATKNSIIGYIEGTKSDPLLKDGLVRGITEEKDAIEYLLHALSLDSKYFATDSETTGLYPRNGYIQGISLCCEKDKGVYISSDCFSEEVVEIYQKLFFAKKAIFHNAKFDISFFQYHLGLKIPDFEDTMLLHYILDETPGTHGLKQLALKYTPYGDYEREKDEWVANFCKNNRIRREDFRWEWIPFEVMYKYAAMDAVCTFALFEKFCVVFQNDRLTSVYKDILIEGTKLLIKLQDNGVPFSKTRLCNSQELMQLQINEAEDVLRNNEAVKAFELAEGKEFNPNSTVQLRKLLFDYLGLKPTGTKTGTGADSTNAEVLEELAEHSEVPQLILTVRQKGKIKNTYLDKIIPELDKDGRLRTGFNLQTTTSGRLSSSGKLNMQQIPRDDPIVKGCIYASPGHKIISIDLTTAEMYIAAVLSNDRALMDVFRNGGDFHSSVAKIVFNLPCNVEDVKKLHPLERQAAKSISFGILYGAGAYKISAEVTKFTGTYFSPNEAQEVIDDYFKKFKGLKKWIDSNCDFIEANGFIYSFFGRKRRLPNVNSSDKGLKAHTIRSGLNFLVQSVASDVNLLAAIDLNKLLSAKGMKARIFALVHDSILAEVPDEEVEQYTTMATSCIKTNRGLSIAGCPIGCDVDIHEDYSMGKFSAKYETANL